MKGPLLSWPRPETPPASLTLAAPGEKHLSTELQRRWRGALDEWGAPTEVGSALERLADPETAVVVTGQQPGILGGPLYSLYKAATAVFWINAEDTDWDEVGWAALPGRDLQLVRHRWTSPLGSRRWVGGAALGLPQALEETFPPGTRPAYWGEPGDHGEVELGGGFARALLSILGTRGLLPLDGRWPELRSAGEPLWRRYLERRAPLAAAVIARGAELAAGGSPPLDAEAADHGLFVLEGDRRGEIDVHRWEAEVRRTLDEGGPERLAPSVLLRAPLQDYVFGSVAHVVGGGEAAYLRQLEPVYEALRVTEPVRVPRLHATLVPRGLIPLEETGEACEDPDGWVSRRAAASLPVASVAALDALKSDVETRLSEVVRGAPAPRGDLEQLAGSAARKIQSQVHRLEEALDRRGRRALYQETPALRHLSEFLRPRRGEQERGLSGATLELLLGAAAPAALSATAAVHIRRMTEGSVHHFVLEGAGV